MNTYSVCESCGKVNRIPLEEAASKAPICGSCKADLPFHFGVTEVSGNGLKTLVAKSPLPIVCDFWASWCGPCKESFPWLNQIQQKYKDKGLVVIGINVDKEKQKADEFLKQNSASFPIIYNASGSLAKQFGVKGMPYSILIGKDGKQLHSHIGFQNSKAQEYSQIIEGALK